MRSHDELKEIFEGVEEREIFTEKEKAAMVTMYTIDYPVQFQDADMTTEEIVRLKEKNMQLLDEAESLVPLVQNILALPPIVVAVETEEEAYV